MALAGRDQDIRYSEAPLTGSEKKGKNINNARDAAYFQVIPGDQ
jgi:hypothetical protein